MKISIVIPIYNGEKYLKKSVDTVLGQSFTEWELILVDDGSKDGSGALCDQIASTDSRIKVFHNINQGVTAARNFGVEQAKGEWICFLDADDTLLPNALQVMLDRCGQSDMVIGNKIIITGASQTKEWMNQRDEVLQPCDFMNGLIKNNISQYITGRMFRRSLFANGTIQIPRELVMAEDFIMNVQLGNKAHSVALIKDFVYGYYVYDESVSHTFRSSMEYEYKFCNCLASTLRQGPYFDYVKDSFVYQKVRALKAAFMSQKGQVDLGHPFLREVCQEAKSISLTRGWKLFLYLLPLKRLAYEFFKRID